MILKYIQNGIWRYIDNIKEVQFDPKNNRKEGEMEGYRTDYTRNDEILTIFLNDTAYLLNDNGKTVERLHL